MLVEEKMKTNSYLLVVTDTTFLDLKVNSINFLFPIKDLSVGFPKTFQMSQIEVPNSYLFVNRVLDQEGIAKLKEVLASTNKNILGICFTDWGVLKVVKDLELSLKLIYMQNHNTTNVTSVNYYLEYVDSVLVSTDITKEEIIKIADGACKPLVVPYFSLVDAMYSRRKLLTNFQEEFGLEKQKEKILEEPISSHSFLAVENDYGTVLYAKNFADYRSISHANILYHFINPLGLDKETLERVLKGKDMSTISDKGFLDKKTYYSLKKDAQIDINAIKKNVENISKTLSSLSIDSIFVEQKGKIDKVFYNKECLHELRSCAKILVAMAIGIAIDRNMLSLDTLLYPVIKDIVKFENENNIEKIKKWNIRHLLMHTTGYEKQMMSERFIVDIDKEKLVDYVFNYDIPYNVGTRFAYNNAEPFILYVFFQEKFGIHLADFIKENLFNPLNIHEYVWGNYGKYCSGATGLFLKHSDFHKIGQLLLNDGVYNGVQIVPKVWINEMCKLQMETPSLYKKERVLPKIGIGYYTFISKDGYIFRDGANGQYILLNKEKNLLITILSSENEMKNVTEVFRNII